jgi:L-tyrosine peroxygenase
VGKPDLVLHHDMSSVVGDAYLETCYRIRLIRDRGAAVVDVERCHAPDELFWFRWITGHQVCFVIWRLMAQVTDDVTGGRLAPASALELLRHYIHGYCAMLLYTGSCPRGVYHSVIRPSMRLRHPSFSGGWAPDYWPVRDLFRARQSPLDWSIDQADLQHAMKLHQLVHDGVAARLVPDGRSLLRQSTARAQNVRLLNIIYDNYFMTLRAPVSRHDVVAQLLRRLVAISQDVAVNGLYPAGMTDLDERPEELLTPEVVGCENSLVEIQWQVASCAAGLYGAGLSADGGPYPGEADERLEATNGRPVSFIAKR